jgi:hypothetical protein
LTTIELKSIHNQRFTMRLRFSLRLAFVVLTGSALALYWLVARPTILANRFVDAITGHDYESAMSLLTNRTLWVFDHGPERTAVVDRIYTEVLPRETTDVWMCRRRIIFRVAYHDDTEARHVEWTEDTDIIARSNGLVVSDFPRKAMLHMRSAMPARHRANQALLP